MEHCGNRRWEYQVRQPASPSPAFHGWSSGRAASSGAVVLPLRDPNVPAEVRWRWADVPPDGEEFQEEPWQDAAPREWGGITADFHVLVKQPRDFRQDPVVQAAALVRGLPVAFILEMPRRMVAADGPEVLNVTGSAHQPGPGAVLRVPEAFSVSNDAFAISNAAASQVTLLPADPAPPSSPPFQGVFAVRAGRLSPEETELLRAWAAENPPATPATP